MSNAHPDDETDDPISYQVQYQEEGRDDWYIMPCRTHGEPFRSETDRGMYELSSMDEAVEIAEALVNGISHPHKYGEYYWRPITAARVTTIVRLAKITATYQARTGVYIPPSVPVVQGPEAPPPDPDTDGYPKRSVCEHCGDVIEQAAEGAAWTMGRNGTECAQAPNPDDGPMPGHVPGTMLHPPGKNDRRKRADMNRIPIHPDPEIDNRTLPADPPPFPSRISGYQVMAYALFPSWLGEMPSRAVAVLRNDYRSVQYQYRTVIARAGDDGVWTAGDGTNDTSYAEAYAVFMDRLGHRI